MSKAYDINDNTAEDAKEAHEEATTEPETTSDAHKSGETDSYGSVLAEIDEEGTTSQE